MRCSVCGSVHKREYDYQDGCPLCNDSYQVINGYHQGRMPLKKIGKIRDAKGHTIHLGVELEVDSFRDETTRDNAAREVYKVMNPKTKQLIKIERDGSLQNGFEVISQPIQFGSHLNSVNWKQMMDVVKEFGGSSHDSGRCGLHVHVEKYSNSFARNIWWLVNVAYKQELKVFSRRQNYGYCRFEEQDDYMSRQESHYIALNTGGNNGRTVEFRFFRGTLKVETFMESLRLVERLTWLALGVEDIKREVESNGFKLPKFTSFLSKYGKEYFSERARLAGYGDR